MDVNEQNSNSITYRLNCDKQIKNHKTVYHITKGSKADPAVYCSLTKILSMNKLTPKTPKDKLPDVVSASAEE